MSQYSELLRAIADGKRLETAHAGAWHPMTDRAAFERMARGDDIEWRDASKVMRQVACDVPAPMSVQPGHDCLYYVPNIYAAESPAVFRWSGDSVDLRYFDAGLCYATKAAAIARARAMLQIESV